ncbi:Sporulation stage II, protein P [Syntrophomonas zehnderi OL-4]|uniref:Sporulation stage II, protein P n=1 Tax=Syntrophomonas zehnderi OL-4 TaxID=690567 RepID=A0A0E3W2F8_9FIRM|nr:stage II sporulation protein P [Syntrophomonas zehnderi]CFW97686.1 Sporulation stage II, protein P [Syntrophomonas zehnderi OL-4]
MNDINKKYIWIFFVILITILVASYVFNSMRSPEQKPYGTETGFAHETGPGQFFTVRDQDGFTLFQTGLSVHVNDRYINENNVEYIIIKVDGMNATANIIQKKASLISEPILKTTLAGQALFPTIPRGKSSHVVVYHTHTDESFIPTSGQASKPGNGDIFAVGDALTTTLRKAGVSVTHSRAAHDPHDINAYSRSRRTLTQLLKEQPDAAFDIHRDSAPASEYYTTINGVDSSRIMIVVGMSNPNIRTNLAYAKQIKDRADELYPGLIRGIFMGRGDYNQDLYPTAMLFEVGTDSISLDLAENAARCLGDVLVKELGVR